jgi:hypothetical protein
LFYNAFNCPIRSDLNDSAIDSALMNIDNLTGNSACHTVFLRCKGSVFIWDLGGGGGCLGWDLGFFGGIGGCSILSAGQS